MTANYDHIAGFYDSLSRLVFGRSIIRAQVCLLSFIPAGARILIVGGGTGWILEEITGIHPQGLTIDYIESSTKMIALSQQRNYQKNIVHFIHQPVEDCILVEQYDVIITPFLFDNFPKGKIILVFEKLSANLKRNGLWLYADFTSGTQNPLWQKILLRVMYLFFRVTGAIETQELISLDEYYASAYTPEFEIFHYAGFIRSVAYRKL